MVLSTSVLHVFRKADTVNYSFLVIPSVFGRLYHMYHVM